MLALAINWDMVLLAPGRRVLSGVPLISLILKELTKPRDFPRSLIRGIDVLPFHL